MLQHLLLAVFLLLGPVGAQAHAISHLTEHHHPHHDDGEPDEPVCGACLAYGHFGAGAPATPTVWAAPTAIPPTAFHTRPNPAPRPTPAYSSRAPPGLSR